MKFRYYLYYKDNYYILYDRKIKMKFRYYLYYKDNYYILYDRKRKIIENKEITFKSMYDYIKYKHYLFTDIYFIFRDYASFDDEKERI